MNLIMASFSGVMSTIGYILIGLLALTFMVVIHELGHYLTGKLFKFKINEFAIGFGPPLLKIKNKKNGELFTIRPIPLGGFCQFEDEDSASDSKTAFNNQAPWKRIIVLAAGATFNFIASMIIITLFFTFYGQILPAVYSVYPDSNNIEVLQAGDVILRVNGKQVNVVEQGDSAKMLSEAPDTSTFLIIRDGKRIEVTVTRSLCEAGSYDENGVFTPTIDEDGNVVKYYGFGFDSFLTVQKLGFFSSLGRSFSFMFFLVYKMLSIFVSLFTGVIGLESLGGPITVVETLSDAAASGFSTLSYTVCLISANLAVMNLLPLPALDGSRIVFCTIEWIFKKPVKKSIEAAIHTAGFFLIIGFAVFIEIYRRILS